ncbi:MAG: DUF1298 domain-containing protein [Actinobacteria bacterium]|nr:DUF1298 domain-containing protein [Actinomycetota bacterium]MBU4249651.1 DUF1298 domain-containing protein [Actinomycetota bacterium]MBU4417112.1 DUF1298 domain-containing protein [Actinomycetota bacterium]MBU4588039.1 DUF1298 domain-containing protein [Actinomycetota bacterium]
MNWPDEPLSRADAANVQLDSADQVNVVLIAGELRPGGFVRTDGSADLAALRRSLAERLDSAEPELRRFSQRIGGDARNPQWRNSPPDLTWHVREVEAQPGRAGLAGLCAELMTTPLPLDRPLWELLVVPGVSQHAPGVILRLHHCVADGAGGVRLVERLLGVRSPQPRPLARPPATPSRGRTGLSLVRMAALLGARIGPTPLLGKISQQRGVAFAEIELDAIAAGARARGGTVNDALLAAVALGVTAALVAAGARVPAELRVSVPVALPDRGDSGNATGVMIADLPTGITDLDELVSRIAAQTSQAKHAARAQGTYELTRSRWGTWLFARLARHQRFAALFVTNVRGPAEALSIGGAELALLWPVTPIQGNIRLGVSAMSYAGRLGCAVHTDASAISAAALSSALQIGLDAIAARPT